MQFELLYGDSKVAIELADSAQWTELATENVPALLDPAEKIGHALDHPTGSPSLAELAQGRRSACVIVCDHTRPVPSRALLSPLLQRLTEAGLPSERTTILIATGLHRKSTPEEILRLIGESPAKSYPVVVHDAQDDSMLTRFDDVDNGFPLTVNRHFVEADLKIATGLIEPHLCAGYSGGAKLVAPGVAGLESIRFMHRPEMMDDSLLGPGKAVNNPFLTLTRRIARRVGLDFVVNVTLNRQRRMTGIFAGEPVSAHDAGIEFKAAHGTVLIKQPVDIALTCGGGAPLDRTLYQTVKGVCGAAPIVRPGGAVLVASPCNEGVGSPSYTKMLEEAESPAAFLKQVYHPGFFQIDQWGVQQYYRVLQEKRVLLHTTCLPPEQIAAYHFEPASDLQAALDRCIKEYGPSPRIAVIPEGPYVVSQLITEHD